MKNSIWSIRNRCPTGSGHRNIYSLKGLEMYGQALQKEVAQLKGELEAHEALT